MKKTKGVINRRMNHRYMIGSLAAVGASSAGAATVQITFANNYVANTAAGGLANWNPDLTGDGLLEGVWASARGNSARVSGAVYYIGTFAFARVGRWRSGSGSYDIVRAHCAAAYETFTQRDRSYVDVFQDVSARSTTFFRFTDVRINGGVATTGVLDVTARSGAGGQEVRINRLIFDDASVSAPGVSLLISYPEFVAVPEPSGLVLLTLGAGGLLARRRRAKSAA